MYGRKIKTFAQCDTADVRNQNSKTDVLSIPGAEKDRKLAQPLRKSWAHVRTFLFNTRLLSHHHIVVPNRSNQDYMIYSIALISALPKGPSMNLCYKYLHVALMTTYFVQRPKILALDAYLALPFSCKGAGYWILAFFELQVRPKT